MEVPQETEVFRLEPDSAMPDADCRHWGLLKALAPVETVVVRMDAQGHTTRPRGRAATHAGAGSHKASGIARNLYLRTRHKALII